MILSPTKLLLLLTLAPIPLFASWDSEYWSSVTSTTFNNQKFRLYTRAQLRFNKDVSELSRMELTEGISYQATSKLNLEAHYTYIYSKSWSAKHFKSTHRLELEANPSLSVKDKLIVAFRNRIEFLKEQKISPIRYIFRQLTKVTFPLKNFGRMTSFNITNEVFYNLSTRYFSQNRFSPLGITLNLDKGLDIDISLMVRNYFSSDKWRRSIVFATELKF